MSGSQQPSRTAGLLLGCALAAAGAAVLWWATSRDALPEGIERQFRSERLALDLLAELPRARVLRDTTSIVFGSKEAREHHFEPDPRLHRRAVGILGRDFGAQGSYAFAIGEEVAIDFVRLRPEACRATLVAIGPSDGLGPQPVEAFVNEGDLPVAEFELGAADSPEPHSFDLPARSLRPGSNVLRLRFGRTHLRSFEGVATELPLAAVLVRLDLGLAGTADPTASLAVEPVLATGGTDASAPAFVLHEGERLELPLVLDPGGTRFHGELKVHPDDARDGRGPRFVVRLRAAPTGRLLLGQGELDASRGDPRARASRVFEVDLSTFGGGAARLEIESEPPPAGAKPLRLALVAPAVRGGEPRPRREAPPKAEFDRLRSALAGANVAVVLLDAAAARHFSAYGAAREVAPTCDLLARDGVVFEGAIAPASYTLASVGSLFTGLLPDRHGVVDDAGTERRSLPKEVTTLAERLAAAGYSTHGIVSNPNAGPEHGYGRGFTRYEPLYDEPALWDEGVAPEAVVERAGARLDEGLLAEPFFLYAHFFPPHAPYRAPAIHRDGIVDPDYAGKADGSRESIERGRRQGEPYSKADLAHLSDLYDANLHHADSQVRALLERLEAKGVLDRTVVVILSDHGEAFGEHGNLEHGDTTYGEEIEIPWIVRLPPAANQAPSRVKGPCSLVDFAPTLLSLLSVPFAEDAFDGVDLSARLFERIVPISPPPRPLIARSAGFAPRYAVRMLGHAYHEDLFTRERLLFDLGADPLERQPLPVSDSPLADALRAELCRALCAIEAPVGEKRTVSPEEASRFTELGYVQGLRDPGTPAPLHVCRFGRR